MARTRRLKTVPDASRDLISDLPAEVKDRILECLPTRDAAITALLSRHWNDVWVKHGRLAFDWEFLESVLLNPREHYYDNKGRTLVNIIDNILFYRAGPVKKFTLEILCDDPQPQQSDFNRWCVYLSRNGVEELNISLQSYLEKYKLSFCLLSCRTIKQLIVHDFIIDLPVNGCGIFSNVTSLAFLEVDFNRSVNGVTSSISIPKLCRGINEFEISSPKLEILSVMCCYYCCEFQLRWLALRLKAIETLWLCSSWLWDVSMFPTAINLQVMKLYELSFGCWRKLTGVMQLLKTCPNLCELQIMAYKGWEGDDKEGASRLLEDPDSCLVIQELKMLNTIQIESFSGSPLEMLFMKMLLSKSPALERVVIFKRWGMNASKVKKIQRKLECFPRASPNAQIVCSSNHYEPMRKYWLDTHGFGLRETYIYDE